MLPSRLCARVVIIHIRPQPAALSLFRNLSTPATAVGTIITPPSPPPPQQQQQPKMATSTPTHILVDKTTTGLLQVPQTEEVAAKVSDLLQRDMERHHVFFNNAGFHNHLVHSLLTLYGTGGSVAALELSFRENMAYQRAAFKPDPTIVAALSSESSYSQYLDKGANYASFLSFFQSEITRLGGIEETLHEHLLKGTPRAEDLLVRLHDGVLHPLIQLMFGVEFNVPAIVAQGLAQAAVHNDKLRDFHITSELMSRSSDAEPMGSIASLYDAVRADEKLANSARFDDDQKITDGVLMRARDEMLAIAARVKVGVDELEERTREMYDAAVYMTVGSAGFVKGKKEKIDFFLMHHTNSSSFYLSLLKLPALADTDKARLLEWKIRLDLLQYAGRGAPPLNLDHLSTISRPLSSKEAFESLHSMEDDGHAIKLARAIEILRKSEEQGGKKSWSHFKEETVWDKILAFVVESIGREGEAKWVRSVGMKEAWNDIPDKEPKK